MRPGWYLRVAFAVACASLLVAQLTVWAGVAAEASVAFLAFTTGLLTSSLVDDYIDSLAQRRRYAEEGGA